MHNYVCLLLFSYFSFFLAAIEFAIFWEEKMCRFFEERKTQNSTQILALYIRTPIFEWNYSKRKKFSTVIYFKVDQTFSIIKNNPYPLGIFHILSSRGRGCQIYQKRSECQKGGGSPATPLRVEIRGEIAGGAPDRGLRRK